MKKVSIVIPVYNERATLLHMLEVVKNASFAGLEKEIIIVDDASNDGTIDLLKEAGPEYKVVFHDVNMGKGAALRTGFKYATGDFTVIQDADLEYNPSDYDKILPLLVNGEADVVYGSRFLSGENDDKFLFKSLIANKFLTFLTNIMYGTKITDMETCYKAFKTEFIKSVEIECLRFNFEPEITAKLVKCGFKITEVPISYNGRNYNAGKKINFTDAISAFVTLLKYRFFG